MPEYALCDCLLSTLAEHYEMHPDQFWQAPGRDLANAAVREMMAELRNEGYAEEEIRGVIRFTRRGYTTYKAGGLALNAASETRSK
jgi:predicted transcriptional regulator